MFALFLPSDKNLGCRGKLKSPSDLSPRMQANSGDRWPVEGLSFSRPHPPFSFSETPIPTVNE